MKKYLTAAILLGTIGFTGISMANPQGNLAMAIVMVQPTVTIGHILKKKTQNFQLFLKRPRN